MYMFKYKFENTLISRSFILKLLFRPFFSKLSYNPEINQMHQIINTPDNNSKDEIMLKYPNKDRLFY